MDERRSATQRRIDALERLDGQGDGWLATADPAGSPHLIAVSAAWDGAVVTIATRESSRSARNLDGSGRARLALGSPDDVVLLDLTVVTSASASDRSSAIARAFRGAVGWDPADEGDDWRYFRLRPLRIQAYRGYGERDGADVMRDGHWLD
jgi:hypothetical protein